MKTKQVDKKAMVALVESKLVNAPDDVKNEIQGFVVKTGKLTTNLGLISANETIQSADRKGYALVKQTRRSVMEGLTMFLSRKAASLASDTGNEVLLAAAEVAPSVLSTLTYENCISKSRSIHAAAFPYLVALGPYGVTADNFSDQATAADSLETYMNTPRASIEERKIATKAIGTLLGKCDVVLEGMDRSVAGIATTQPEFYELYFNCRQINDTGGRVLSLRGKMTKADGSPLKGVKILIKGANITKISTDKGNFQVKHLDAGVWNVLCTKPGYSDYKTTVAITDNERTELVVVMKEVEVAV